jgi:hypothetical protein
MTIEERDMIYLALLNKAADLRRQSSGRPREERDEMLSEADRYSALAVRIQGAEIVREIAQ